MSNPPTISITDRRWFADAIGRLAFLTAVGLILYVWATSLRPISNHVLSAATYYGVLAGLAVALLTLLRLGFTYRRIDVTPDGLVVHENYYGLIARKRLLSRPQIRAIESYDELRPGVFARVMVSGLRVRLSDDSLVVLTEQIGTGRFQHEAAQLRELLGQSR
jgi:hypothetical protein